MTSIKQLVKKKCPPRLLAFLRLAKEFNVFGIIRLIAPSMSSRTFWETREIGNKAYIDGYWNDWSGGFRMAISQTIANLDVDSVAETGAHCGVNLLALSKLNQYKMLSGADISPWVVSEGRKRLEANMTTPWALEVSSADKLPWADKSHDVVLASGVLLCVGPREIESAILEMIRVARRYLVLAEPYETDNSAATVTGHKYRYTNTDYWIRNLPLFISNLVQCRVVSIKHLGDQSLGHINSITVLSLE